MDTRNHDLLRPGLRERFAERRQLPLGKILAIRGIRQNAGLGEIRGQKIRKAQKLVHPSGKLRRVRRIELSVVAHHRVDQNLRMFPFEPREKVLDDVDLPRRAEKARGNAVKV